MLHTSGFVTDIVFSHYGLNGGVSPLRTGIIAASRYHSNVTATHARAKRPCSCVVSTAFCPRRQRAARLNESLVQGPCAGPKSTMHPAVSVALYSPYAPKSSVLLNLAADAWDRVICMWVSVV